MKKLYLTPSVLTSIFDQGYSKLDRQTELIKETKNKKVIYICSQRRLAELFTISNACATILPYYNNKSNEMKLELCGKV